MEPKTVLVRLPHQDSEFIQWHHAVRKNQQEVSRYYHYEMCDSLAVHEDVHRPAVHLTVVFVSVLPSEEEEEEEKRQQRVWAACQPSAAVELGGGGGDALTMSSLASFTDVTANTKISGMAVVYQSSADTSGINCTDTHADMSVFEI